MELPVAYAAFEVVIGSGEGDALRPRVSGCEVQGYNRLDRRRVGMPVFKRHAEREMVSERHVGGRGQWADAIAGLTSSVLYRGVDGG